MKGKRIEKNSMRKIIYIKNLKLENCINADAKQSNTSTITQFFIYSNNNCAVKNVMHSIRLFDRKVHSILLNSLNFVTNNESEIVSGK